MIRKLKTRPPDHSELTGLSYIQNLEHKRTYSYEKVYCVDKSPLDCNFPVFFYGKHNGGGPLFIDYIFSKKEFLEEHKDCKTALEVCSGPGFIGFYLYKYLNLDFINFVDINGEVEESVNKTIQHNNVNGKFFTSDALDDYTGGKVDLIVMNPPFFTTEEEFNKHIEICGIDNKESIERSRLITLDKNFKFHSKLVDKCLDILTDNGRIVFLEVINNIEPSKIINKLKGGKRMTNRQFRVESQIPNYYTLTIYKM